MTTTALAGPAPAVESQATPRAEVVAENDAHEQEVDRRLGTSASFGSEPARQLAPDVEARLANATAWPHRAATSHEQLALHRRTSLRADGAIVHDDAASASLADALDAHAFTVDQHVFLGPAARDAPGIVTHELAHVALGHGQSPDQGRIHRVPKGFQKRSQRFKATKTTSLRARIFFATDESSLGSDDVKVIEAMAHKHKTLGATSIRFGVHGYADESGGLIHNLDLSENRANMVGAQLETSYSKAGIPIETVSYPHGEDESPASTDADEMAAYRRVDVRVEGSTQRGRKPEPTMKTKPDRKEPTGESDAEDTDVEAPGVKSTGTQIVGGVGQVGSVANTAAVAADATKVAGAIGNAGYILGFLAPFFQFGAFVLTIESRGDDIEQAVMSRGFAYGVVAEAVDVELDDPATGGSKTRQAFREGESMGRQALRMARRAAPEPAGEPSSSSKSLESWLNEIHLQVVDEWFSEDFLWLIPSTSPGGVQEQGCRLRWPGPSWSASGGVCVEP